MRKLIGKLRRLFAAHPRISSAAGILLLVILFLVLRTPSWVVKVDGYSFDGKSFTEDREIFFSDLPFVPGESSPGVVSATRSFLNHWVNERLILARAEELDITVSEDEAEKGLGKLRDDLPEEVFQLLLVETKISPQVLRRRAREMLLMEKAMQREIAAPPAVPEAEVRGYFEQHRAEFSQPVQIRAAQMTITTEDRMAAVMQAIENGVSFEEVLARQGGQQGGDLGYFSQGELPPEFDAVLFGLKPGDVSQPVHTPYGYHLFKVIDRQEAHPLAYEEAAGRIREKLASARRTEAAEQWIEKLRKEYRVRINYRHPALAGISPAGGNL